MTAFARDQPVSALQRIPGQVMRETDCRLPALGTMTRITSSSLELASVGVGVTIGATRSLEAEEGAIEPLSRCPQTIGVSDQFGLVTRAAGGTGVSADQLVSCKLVIE